MSENSADSSSPFLEKRWSRYSRRIWLRTKRESSSWKPIWNCFRQSTCPCGSTLLPLNSFRRIRRKLMVNMNWAQSSMAGRNVAPSASARTSGFSMSGIFGRTGAGKTNLGFKIVEELVKHGKPVSHPRLEEKLSRSYSPSPSSKTRKCIRSASPSLPSHSIRLIPPPGTNPKTWLKKLDEVIAHSYMLGNGVLYLLQQTLDQLYEEFGVYDGTVQRWPTLQDVLDKARKLDVRGREAGWLSSTLRALASLCFGDMGDLVNHPSANSPDQLLDETVILELDALTQQDKIFFASALLLWIHHRRMTEPTREQFKHAIVIEEAHHLLADERKSLVGGQSVMEITFREIREFGESMVLLDQHPSQISLPALGNTFATISLNLKTSKDVNAMAQCMLLENEEKDILGSLEVGQAVVKLQGRVQGPFLIGIPEFQIVKGAVTDEMVRARMGMEEEHASPRISNQDHKLPAPPVPSLPSIATGQARDGRPRGGVSQ